MIQPFIPCKDFEISRTFYARIGFQVAEVIDGDSKTSEAIFRGEGAIILQDFYVKDWAENTMMTLNVDDLDAFIALVKTYQTQYPDHNVRFRGPQDFGWGHQIHLLDPSGVLWHVFQKNKSQPNG